MMTMICNRGVTISLECGARAAALAPNRQLGFRRNYDVAVKSKSGGKNGSDPKNTGGKRRTIVDTPAQALVRGALASNGRVLTVVLGPAGSGKTVLAMGAAVEAVSNGLVTRVVTCRPTVGLSGSAELGHLPGTLDEKLTPWLRPALEAAGPRAAAMQARGELQVLSIAHARGLTLDDTFLVVDEAQNTTPGELCAILTRAGEGTRVAVVGDPDQCDLPGGWGSSGLRALVAGMLQKPGLVEGSAVHELSECDVQRSTLARQIVRLFSAPPGGNQI